MSILFLDVETTTFNKGHPFDPRNELVSYAYAIDDLPVVFKYYTDPDFSETLREVINKPRSGVYCNFQCKFDLHWLANAGITLPLDCQVWDCQLAEFIYSGQELRFDSLNAACERYGIPVKQDVVKGYWDAGIDTKDIPIQILEEYNKWDVQITRLLYKAQQQVLDEKTKQLILLQGDDLKALQDAEWNGIKFDKDGALRACEKGTVRCSEIEQQLSTYLPDGIPPGCFNWDSGDHLSALLYGGNIEFKYVQSVSTYKTGIKAGQVRQSWARVSVVFPQRFKPLEGSELKKTKDISPLEATANRFYSTDAPTLLQLKSRSAENKELLKLLRHRANEIKIVEMVEGIMKKFTEKQWEDDIMHGQFNQNVVVTGRLSSSQPNLQNQPPEVDKFLVSRYDN